MNRAKAILLTCHLALCLNAAMASEDNALRAERLAKNPDRQQTPEAGAPADEERAREIQAASAEMFDFMHVAGNKAVHRELGFSEEQASQVRKLLNSYIREGDAIRLMKIDDLAAEQRDNLKNLAVDEQKKQLSEIKKELRASNRDLHEAAVRKLIKPDDCDRIVQIRLQLRGSLQLIEADLVEALGLTNEQRQQIAKLNLRYGARGNDMPRNLGKGGAIAWQVEMTQERNEMARLLLTGEQRQSYEKLLGKPFDIATFLPILPLRMSEDRQKKAAF